MVLTRIAQGWRGRRLGVEHRVHQHAAVAMLHGDFQCLAQALPVGVVQSQAVLHGLHGIAIARLQPGIPLSAQQLDDFLFAEIVRHPDGHAHMQTLLGRQVLVQVGDDALRSVPPHQPRTLWAMQHGQAGEGELQVVVQFGHGADGRARGAHGIALVDGDGGRDAQDAVDRGFVHAIQELPGIGGERLDVAALSFCVERVEGQRGFAGAADPGDDDQSAKGQIEIQILEIVLARPADADAVLGSGCRSGDAHARRDLRQWVL